MEKAKLYKTAQIKKDIPWAAAGLEPGQIVGVKFFCTAFNYVTAKKENVYLVSSTNEFSRFSPMMYENALESFVL